MKAHDVAKALESAIQSYLQYTGSSSITHQDKFALYTNLVRSNKHSDAELREMYYKILEL